MPLNSINQSENRIKDSFVFLADLKININHEPRSLFYYTKYEKLDKFYEYMLLNLYIKRFILSGEIGNMYEAIYDMNLS